MRKRNHSCVPRALGYAAGSVVPGRRTALPDLEGPQHQIQLVVDHEQVPRWVRFKLLNQSGHCNAAQVHKRLRLGQNHLRALQCGRSR